LIAKNPVSPKLDKDGALTGQEKFFIQKEKSRNMLQSKAINNRLGLQSATTGGRVKFQNKIFLSEENGSKDKEDGDSIIDFKLINKKSNLDL
jgi:hypothetical protein